MVGDTVLASNMLEYVILQVLGMQLVLLLTSFLFGVCGVEACFMILMPGGDEKWMLPG